MKKLLLESLLLGAIATACQSGSVAVEPVPTPQPQNTSFKYVQYIHESSVSFFVADSPFSERVTCALLVDYVTKLGCKPQCQELGDGSVVAFADIAPTIAPSTIEIAPELKEKYQTR